MSGRKRPDPVQVVKERRDRVLEAMVGSVPYISFLGVEFDRRGDELTAVLRYSDKLIGNPMLPALHGGVTAAFLEISAIIGLSWHTLWPEFEGGDFDVDAFLEQGAVRLPRTIDFSVDYLRSGLPRDAYARARINRLGRRYASVQVDAWQDNRERLYAQGIGHFLMPQDV